MESLGETMKYAAPIARAAGFSLEETAAAAGILGDAGIQGLNKNGPVTWRQVA